MNTINTEGIYILPVPSEQLWDLLDNPVIIPQVLAKAFEEVTTVEAVEEDTYKVTGKVKLGFFAVTATGMVMVSNKVRPTSQQLTITGKGPGVQVKTDASIKLEQHEKNATKIFYTGKSSLEGLAAVMPEAVANSIATSYINRFFNALTDRIKELIAEAEAQE